jgi:hypothetical protein
MDCFTRLRTPGGPYLRVKIATRAAANYGVKVLTVYYSRLCFLRLCTVGSGGALPTVESEHSQADLMFLRNACYSTSSSWRFSFTVLGYFESANQPNSPRIVDLSSSFPTIGNSYYSSSKEAAFTFAVGDALVVTVGSSTQDG